LPDIAQVGNSDKQDHGSEDGKNLRISGILKNAGARQIRIQGIGVQRETDVSFPCEACGSASRTFAERRYRQRRTDVPERAIPAGVSPTELLSANPTQRMRNLSATFTV